MKIEHTGITIVLENENERRLIQCMAAIANEMANDAIRGKTVPSILVRCGLDPVNIRDTAEMRDMAERLCNC